MMNDKSIFRRNPPLMSFLLERTNLCRRVIEREEGFEIDALCHS